MSVNLTVFVGWAVKLDYNEYKNKIPDENEWEPFKDDKVCFVSDGMNGDYIYLINIQVSVKDTEMYKACERKFDILRSENIEEMKRLYKIVTGKNLKESQIEFLFFTHCW